MGDSTAAGEASDGVPQRDAIDVLKGLFGREVKTEVRVTPRTGMEWAILPTFSYNPVYGAAFGALISGAGRRGSARARYSNLAVSANYSTTGQLQAQVRGDIYSLGENYLMKADFRYLDTERSTWGLGPLNTQQGEYPMTFVLQRLYLTALREVTGRVYVGLGFHYDEFSDIVDERAAEGESTPFSEYSGGLPSKTRAVGVSMNLLADLRDNLVNPKRGYYVSGSFHSYLDGLGSDQNWQDLWVEARVYPHLPAHSDNVLAFWLYGWMTFGPAPYLNLPSNGWDTYGRGGRGYLAGRIRGANQIYVESEYRFSISDDGLWGMVIFANGMSTTDTDTGTFARVDPAAGIGLRIKFNKHTDTNLAIDYAVGRDGSDGVFLGMTEVF